MVADNPPVVLFMCSRRIFLKLIFLYSSNRIKRPVLTVFIFARNVRLCDLGEAVAVRDEQYRRAHIFTKNPRGVSQNKLCRFIHCSLDISVEKQRNCATRGRVSVRPRTVCRRF